MIFLNLDLKINFIFTLKLIIFLRIMTWKISWIIFIYCTNTKVIEDSFNICLEDNCKPVKQISFPDETNICTKDIRIVFNYHDGKKEKIAYITEN